MSEWERRFWPRVHKTESCWLWQGETNKKGYGLFRSLGKPRRARVAHAFLWEQMKGSVPDGKVLDHLCRVHNCVKLEHLEPVTNRENILRGIGPTAQNARKTHCKRGHALIAGNIYSPPSRSERWCIECGKARKR